MGKCEFCGQEVDLPFKCPFCNGYFCIEHRLPENHSCINAPSRTPLGHWKAKPSKLEPKELPSLPRRIPLSIQVKCPECDSAHTMCTAYRERFITFRCLDCGFKWKQPRFKERELKPLTFPSPKRTWRQMLHKTFRNVKTIGVFVICLVILGVFILSWTNLFAQIIMPQTVDTAKVETKIFELINEERADRDLPILLEDEALKTIASEWSRHMAEIGNLTHGNFEDRIARIGYSYYQCGEIIAMHGGWLPTLGRAFVDMWLGSHGHREIMLTPLGGYMGVGVSKQGNHFFAVVDFRFVG